MTASRNPSSTTDRCAVEHGLPTAAVVRRQATPAAVDKPAPDNQPTTTAFGAALPTPATSIAGVDNAQRFSVIVDG